MLEKLKSIGGMVIAFGIVCLALSIVYFTLEIQKWRKDLPDMLRLTGKTAEKITPAVSEVSDVAKLIPSILEEVAKSRETIGELLKEVKASRKLVPGILKDIQPITKQIENTTEQLPQIVTPILDEVSKTRETIPGILEEIRETNATIRKALVEIRETRDEIPAIVKNVEAIRRDLPTWLASIDKASEAIEKISGETGEVRVLIPDILEEMEKTREALPAMMDRADRIVSDAKVAGKEAGKGAVGGIISGIISTPFEVISGSAKTVKSMTALPAGKDLTERDNEIIKEGIIILTETGKVGQTVEWKNPESKHSGKITLLKKYKEKGQECHQVRHEFFVNGIKDIVLTQSGCQQTDGSWVETDMSVSD